MTSDTATTTAPAAQATHTGRDGKGIQITESAMKQLATLLPAQGDGKVLRVGVRSGGCSGMSYTMDFIDAAEIQGDDERYEQGGEFHLFFFSFRDQKAIDGVSGKRKWRGGSRESKMAAGAAGNKRETGDLRVFFPPLF